MKFSIAAIAALFYILAFIVDRSASVLFFLLLLSGLAGIALREKPMQLSFGTFLRTYWPLHLAMAGPLIAVIANQAITGEFAGRSYDSPLRLALFPLAFWALLTVPGKLLKQIQWAWIIGTFACAIKMYVLTKGGQDRYGTDFIPIIIFAEWTLLLGFFSVLSIGWQERRETSATVLKIAAACAALYADYLSQSRGTWMTTPVFAVLTYFVIRRREHQYKLLLATAASLIAFLFVAYHFGSAVRERVAVAMTDVQQYVQGTNVDTSIGVRFQLWQGSWLLYKEHPLVGIGAEGFPAALQDLAARKIITPMAATFPHSHNEVLFMMAKLGTVGLLAILALYFVPIAYFLRAMRNEDRAIRSAAAMGLLLCLGFFTLGWTDVVFIWWEAFPFYSISIALFLACIAKRSKQLRTGDAEVRGEAFPWNGDNRGRNVARPVKPVAATPVLRSGE